MKRHLDKVLKKHIKERKQAVFLLGPRQVGKTTILKKLFNIDEANYYLLDNESERKLFDRYDISAYKSAIPELGEKIIVLDELHLLKDPGRATKILYDSIDGIKIIATGSSALNIKNKTSESMAGRAISYRLYPLTFSEYLNQRGITDKLDYKIYENLLSENIPAEKDYLFDIGALLNEALVYGTYPHLVDNPRDTKYLASFADSVLFKDIIELDLIENKSDAKKLLKLLAFQVGNLINYTQISNQLSMDIRTVQRYIEIFEQSYILFRLYPYGVNKKLDLVKSPKVYFYDLGLRNSLINNFNDLEVRNDVGAMFENFIITEFVKANEYKFGGYDINFWRSKQGAEVDLVISKADKLFGVEMKFTDTKFTKTFKTRYPNANCKVINSRNFY